MQSHPQVGLPPYNQPPQTKGALPQYVDIQPAPQQGCCSGNSQNYNIKAGRATGIIQLLLGIIIVIINALSFVFGHFGYPNQGEPIGSAVFFVIPSGIIGITTTSRRNCLLISYLVMSILSTISAIGGVITEGIAAGVFSYGMVCSGFFCHWGTFGEAVILHSICAALLFIEVIVAIVASVYCGKGLVCCQGCCCCPSNDVAATATTTVTYPTMQLLDVTPA